MKLSKKKINFNKMHLKCTKYILNDRSMKSIIKGIRWVIRKIVRNLFSYLNILYSVWYLVFTARGKIYF